MKNTKYLTVLSLGTFLILAGCSSEPEWVAIYEDCKTQVAQVKKSPETQAMGAMFESIGMAACEMVKNSCEQDPNGATCKAYIDAYKKE